MVLLIIYTCFFGILQDEPTKKEDSKEEAKEDKDKGTEKMEVDEKQEDKSAKDQKEEKEKKEEDKKEGEKDKKEGEKDKKEGEKDKKEEEKKKKEPEPNFEMLANPARVMKAQLRVLAMPDDCRYKPIKDVSIRVRVKRDLKGILYILESNALPAKFVMT